MSDQYQETVEHMLGRLTGEVRSCRLEVDQLRDAIGDLREELQRERDNRRELLTEVWNSVHELYQLGGRR